MIILIIILILIVLLIVNKYNSKNTECFSTGDDTSVINAISQYDNLAAKVTALETKTAKITATDDGINVEKSITFDNSLVITSVKTFPDTLFIMRNQDYSPINRMAKDIKPSRVEIKMSDNSSPIINYFRNNSPMKSITYTPTLPILSLYLKRWGQDFLSFYKIRIYSPWANGKNITTDTLINWPKEYSGLPNDILFILWRGDSSQSSILNDDSTQFGLQNTLNKNNDVSKMVHTQQLTVDAMHDVSYRFVTNPSLNKVIIINRRGFRGRLKGAQLVLNGSDNRNIYVSTETMGLTGNTTYADDNDGYDIYSFIFPNKKPIGQNISDIGQDIYDKLITSDDDVLTTMPIQ